MRELANVLADLDQIDDDNKPYSASTSIPYTGKLGFDLGLSDLSVENIYVYGF